MADTKLSGVCTFRNYDAFQDTFQNTRRHLPAYMHIALREFGG
jgi:hypothetical protein